MRGRKNPDKVPANHLPPCRVCGEASTGFHYGVITCIACKGFFRRSLARTVPYPCLQNHLCRIGLCNKRRQLCPKCRYDKCVKVGMSREGCKVGRYSRDKKFEYHKEAMEQEKLSQTGQASSSPPSLSSTLTAATSSSPPSSSSSSSLTSSVSALPGQSSEGNTPRPDNHAPRPDSHAPRPHSHAPLHNGHPPDNPTHEACSTYTHHEDDNDTDNYNDSDDGGDDDYHHKNDDADNGDKTDPRHHHHQNYHTSDPDEPKDDSTRHQGNDLHHHHSNQEDSLQFDVDEIGVEMFEILSVSAFGDCDDASDDNDDNDDNNKGADDDNDENNDDNKGDQFYRDHTLPKKSKKTFLELQPLGKHSFHSSSETENTSLTTPPCETLVSGSPLLRLPRYAPPTKPQPSPLRQCETDSSSTFLLGQQQQQNDLDLNHTVCEIDTVALGPVEKNRSNKNNSNTNNNNNNNDNDNNHHQALIDATIQATQSETHPDPSVDFPEVLDTLEFDESCFPSNVLPRMTGSYSLSPTTTLHPFPPSFDNDSSWAVNLLRQFNDVAASSGHLVTGFSLKGEGDENPQTERSGGGALDAGTYAKDCVGRRGNVGVVMPNNVGIITSLSSGVGTTLHNGVVRTPSANTDTPAPSPKDRDPISSPVPYAVGTGNNPSGSEFNPHTNVYHNRNYRNYSQTGSEEVAIPNNLVTGTPHCDSPLYEPSHTLQRMENNNINNHGVNTIPNTQFNSDHSATPRVPPTHLNNSSALPLTPTTPPPPPPPFPHHHHNNEPTTLALQSTSLRIDPSPPPPDVTARILSVIQIRFQLTSYEKTELEDILQNGIQTINIPAIKALLSQSNTPDNHFIKNTQPPLPSPTDLTSTPRNPEAEKQEPTGETLLEDIGAKASSSVSIRRLKDYCPADLRGAIDFEYDAREMEAMFEDIQTRHTRVYGDRSKLTSADMTDALDAYWNICQLQENLQGPLNIMDDETYYRVLESTGIDIDRRRVYFLSYLEYFDSWMVRDIRFFKNLPGFKQFTLHDRTALTKSTFSVFGFVKDFRGWDRTRRIVVGEEGLTGFCADKTVRVFPDFALTLAGLLEVYDDLLTYDPCLREMMLIKALLVMTPYTYESLEHPELVCQWYNKYLSCMLCLIRKLHGTGPYADERFSQLLAVLEKLKHLRGTFREFMLSTVEQLLKLIDSEQAMIFREVFAYFKYEADDLDT